MIAIPNMDRPKDCIDCIAHRLYDHDGYFWHGSNYCRALGKYFNKDKLDIDPFEQILPDCPLIGIDKETEHHILNLWEYAKDMGVNMEQARKDLTVVDLVTCGECKWSYTDERDGLMWCKVHMSHYRVNADHFCSYGGRRTDES